MEVENVPGIPCIRKFDDALTIFPGNQFHYVDPIYLFNSNRYRKD